jgi:hypothetical protein
LSIQFLIEIKTMKRSLQTTLFPDLDTRTVIKPEPGPLEKDFMRDVQRYAASLGLPSIHIEYFCGNKFFVECPCCGTKVLAHCRKSNNKENAGLPDLLFLKACIEVKRDGFEPSPLQVSTHEALQRQGVLVITVSPGSVSEAMEFLKNISAKGK